MDKKKSKHTASRTGKTKNPFSPELCLLRRRKLAASIRNGVAVVFSADASGHAEPFRQASDLLYLTGCNEPRSALVLTVSKGAIEDELLYCRPRDQKTEKWDGPMLGLEGARRKLHISQARAWEGPERVILHSFARHKEIFIDLSSRHAVAAVTAAKDASQRISSLRDIHPHVAKLRMVKDNAEIEAIETAAKITGEGFRNVAAALAQCDSERQIAAVLSATYIEAGARHAFMPIVASGANACIAHYIANTSPLRRGKLLLVDSGCELDGYCSDMTRVFPIGGKFSQAQKDMVSVVCSAQKAAIKKIKPKSTMEAAQKAASMELARGLKFLGICRGKPEKIIDSEEFRELYFHSIGHMLGLEVHDPLVKANDDMPPLLRRGNVVTIEPGLYLDGRKSVPPELRNTGVRIEDLLTVASKGSRSLTSTTPSAPGEVERLL